MNLKKTYLLLFFIYLNYSSYLLCQVNIKGQVVNMDNNNPISNVFYTALFSSEQGFTTQKGEYELDLTNQQPGDDITLNFSHDEFRLVNDFYFEDFVIPKNIRHERFKVYMCPDSNYNKCKLKFFKDKLWADIYIVYEQELKEANTKEKKRKIKDKFEYKASIASSLAEYEPKSKQRKAYFRYLLEGDYDKALESLISDEEIEIRTRKAENEYKQVINDLAYEYYFKALSYLGKRMEDEAERYYDLAYKKDSSDITIALSYATFSKSNYRYKKAIRLLNQVLILSKLTEDNIKTADIYFELGNIHLYLYNDSLGTNYLNQAISLYQDNLKNTDDLKKVKEGLIYGYLSMGDRSLSNYKFSKAKSFYSESLKISEELFREDSLYIHTYIQSLLDNGYYFWNDLDYTNALKYYNRAEKLIKKQLLSKKANSYSLKLFLKVTSSIASIHIEIKNHVEAYTLIDQLLRITADLAEQDLDEYLFYRHNALSLAGDLYRLNNLFDQANQYYQDALNIIKQLPIDDPRYLRMLMSISDKRIELLEQEFKYQEIIKVCDETLSLIDFYKDSAHNQYLGNLSSIYHDLGYYYKMTQQYNKSIYSFSSSLSLKEKLLSENQQKRKYACLSSLMSLGVVYCDYQDSTTQKIDELTEFKLNTQLSISSRYPFLAYLSLTENDLGIRHYSDHNFSKSREYLLRALSYIENTDTINIRYKDKQARIFNNLAVLYHTYNEKEKALEYYNKSLKIRHELINTAYMEYLPDFIATSTNYGIFLFSIGAEQEGITIISENLIEINKLIKENDISYNIEHARLRIILGFMYYKKNNIECIKQLKIAKELIIPTNDTPLKKKIYKDIESILNNSFDNYVDYNILPTETINDALKHWEKANYFLYSKVDDKIEKAKNEYLKSIEIFKDLINHQDNVWYTYTLSFLFDELSIIEEKNEEKIALLQKSLKLRLYIRNNYPTLKQEEMDIHLSRGIHE